MTRFARSVGSKASNKREPEEATPWGLMVGALKGNVEGAAGVEDEVEYGAEEDDEMEEKEDVDDGNDDEDINEYEELLDEEDNTFGDQKRKLPLELVSQEEPKKKKRKKSEKCLICGEKGHRKMDCPRLPEDRRKELQELFTMKVERKGKGTGRKKKKAKNTEENILPFETAEDNTENFVGEEAEKDIGNITKIQKIEKKKGKPKKDKAGALIEKGEGLFQGFRVKLEDQKRLQQLEKKLRHSGVIGDELELTLKRERRMAEKNLSRSKKIVCFNCREPGHLLAECPGAVSEANEQHTPAPVSGQCYKCGSLEHSSKDCKSKLKREGAYRFAVCFICKEEGHLAKACPDNPKGLYPKGGGCVFCGSVEHLKRDCQRKVEKDLARGVRVGVIGNDLEDEPINEPIKKGNVKKVKQKKISKVVAF